MPPCCSAGGIFSVALSVTEPHRVELSSTPPAEACNSALQRSLRGRPLALPGALPSCPEAAVRQLRGCPSPKAQGFVTGSCEPTTTVSGLSSRPDCSRPAITRPVRQFHYSSVSSPSALHLPRRPTRLRVTNRSRGLRVSLVPSPGFAARLPFCCTQSSSSRIHRYRPPSPPRPGPSARFPARTT